MKKKMKRLSRYVEKDIDVLLDTYQEILPVSCKEKEKKNYRKDHRNIQKR